MSGKETFIVLESLVILGCFVVLVLVVLVHRDSMDKNRRLHG